MQSDMGYGYRFGRCEFEPAARRLSVDGSEALLGGRAFDLLQALVERHDRVVDKDELYELVWPGLAVEPNNLQVQVWALRKLLGREAIATVARRGYRFMLPVERVLSPAAPRPRLQDAPASGDADDLHQALGAAMRQHRLVSVIGPGGPAMRQHVQAAAQATLAAMPGGVWQVEAALLCAAEGGEPPPPTTPALHTLLARLQQRQALLVVHQAQEMHGLAAALQALQRLAPRLHLCVTAPRALGLPDEVSLALADNPTESAAADATMPLRWRPRPAAV